jgi:hypothetical protein
MAAQRRPDRTSAVQQSLLHFVGQFPFPLSAVVRRLLRFRSITELTNR